MVRTYFEATCIYVTPWIKGHLTNIGQTFLWPFYTGHIKDRSDCIKQAKLSNHSKLNIDSR